MSASIVWFRQDLRCQDNPALTFACEHHNAILPLYIADDNAQIFPRGAQKWWLHHSLKSLDNSLQHHHLNLCLLKGQPLLLLKKLIATHSIEAVYWNRCYEPQTIARDKIIKAQLEADGIKVITFNGSLLNEPWNVTNQSKHYFKVFTPYWKKCLQQMVVPAPLTITRQTTSIDSKSDKLDDWKLLPNKPDWAQEFSNFWEPGEEGALKKLKLFICNHLQDYNKSRDLPAEMATSKLSPHLHFGEISPRQLWRAIDAVKQQNNCDLTSVERFLAEIGWREFSYHLLYHYPQLPTENFKQDFNGFAWLNDKNALKKWQKGLTGYPIVDAGMRELWQTGTMHNRVRMIAASFLIKDLLIDWRFGADWFLETLLDADLASNSASWQWVAGSGADAAPYFRIFNPVLQGKKFDPQGAYVKRWIPELSNVSIKWLHAPWEAPANELPILLGKDYPHPLVDHDKARKLALLHYQAVK